MVLAYSAAGLVIYVLSSLLSNQFSAMYRKLFPKLLIPIVIMQLISVGIRLNAYGITESRYYVALFGIFSITTAIILSFKPFSRNGIIALLAAGFAILSIIPPVDAFTVSRVSQIARVEQLLQSEGVLQEGKLMPKANVSAKVKEETTNIFSYLENRSSLKYISWLPADFNYYEDMKVTLGFDQTYPNGDIDAQYFYASLNAQIPMDVSGFDTTIPAYSNRMDKATTSFDMTIRGVPYKLQVVRESTEEARVSVLDASGVELISTGLHDFANNLMSTGISSKDAMPPEAMTLAVTKDGYKLKLIFQNISASTGNATDLGVDYAMYVMFAAPAAAK
jgi:hypothetical protein